MLFQALTLAAWFRQWAAEVKIVLWVTPRILGCFSRGTIVLLVTCLVGNVVDRINEVNQCQAG